MRGWTKSRLLHIGAAIVLCWQDAAQQHAEFLWHTCCAASDRPPRLYRRPKEAPVVDSRSSAEIQRRQQCCGLHFPFVSVSFGIMLCHIEAYKLACPRPKRTDEYYRLQVSRSVCTVCVCGPVTPACEFCLSYCVCYRDCEVSCATNAVVVQEVLPPNSSQTWVLDPSLQQARAWSLQPE
jgi:hypothetical protein